MDINVRERSRLALIQHSRKNNHIAAAMKNRDTENPLKKMTPQITVKEAFDAQSNPKEELSFVDKVAVAETLWAAAVATCHLPLNATDTIVPTFAAMFPDSRIAASMECRREKRAEFLLMA